MKKGYIPVSLWVNPEIQKVLKEQRRERIIKTLRVERMLAMSHMLSHYESYRVLQRKILNGWHHPLEKTFPDYTKEGLLLKCTKEMECWAYIFSNINLKGKVRHYIAPKDRYWREKGQGIIIYYFPQEMDLRHKWERDNESLWGPELCEAHGITL